MLLGLSEGHERPFGQRLLVGRLAQVLAALRQRARGWKPAGPFSLGGLGVVVNVLALAYGLFAMYLLAKPGESGDFVTDWVVLIGLGIVVVSGLLYLFIARPDKKSSAPEGDAIAVAEAIRARTGATPAVEAAPVD